MYFHFVCQVDRLNSTAESRRQYIFSSVGFECTAADDEILQRYQLSMSRPHVELVSYPKSLEVVANQRENIEELKSAGLFDERKGGVQLWLPDSVVGTLYVSLLSGSDGLGDFEIFADRALQSEHLFLQFSINVGFSKFENNPLVPRPVTFDMFRNGTCMYVEKLPDVGLVRRHIP